MQTYKGEEFLAGDYLKYEAVLRHPRTAEKQPPATKYVGVISFHNDYAWLTDPADSIEEVDFFSRNKLISESELQLKKYELVQKGK